MAVNVRYIVDDLNAAIAFHSGSLGFRVERSARVTSTAGK